MGDAIKKTPLNGWHAANGGNLVTFGDYEMPLWYSSAKDEHLVCLTNAGTFDTSHMAVVLVSGSDAFDILQLCFTRDLNACVGKDNSPLVNGRCVYGAFLNEKGQCIDDAIVYQFVPGDFMVVVNAGMGGVIAGHLAEHGKGKDVKISDMTDKLGKMDIQGPASLKIMSKIVADPGKAFDKLPYFGFNGHFDASSPLSQAVRLKDGTPFLLSRSGYTGEFGFEIFSQPGDVVKIWEQIQEAGKEFGLMACGLAARDSLRTGALLPLSHQDIGAWTYQNHPWIFALPGKPGSFTKKFIGGEALDKAGNKEYTVPFVGSDLRKVSSHDPQAVVLDAAGQEIGVVLTCATDIAIGWADGRIYCLVSPDKPADFKAKGLCCGFIKVNRPLKPGDEVELKDNRRALKVKIVEDIRPDRTARKPLKSFA